MKRLILTVFCLLLMTGCSGGNKELDRAAQLRSELLNASQCTFLGEITADYGSELYAFSVECTADKDGDIRFQITAPQTIAGISGTLTYDKGTLCFQDTVLQIGLLADDQLAPVAVPWIFLKTLRSGYVTAAGMEEELLRLTIQDGYEEGALQADIWVDSENRPVQGEFLYEGKRILSLKIIDFQIR